MTHAYQHQTLSFDPAALENIVCMDDFYNTVGLMEVVKNDGIVDVQQVWMNADQANVVAEFCKQNIRKNKKYKHYSKHDLELAVAMDWLNYCPVSVEYIPENEIWIWSTEHYRQAMDEYRAWNKNNSNKEI